MRRGTLLDRSGKGLSPLMMPSEATDRRGRRIFRRPFFLFLLLLSAFLIGCAGTPKIYETGVEVLTGKGNLTLVVQEPSAWEPTQQWLLDLLLEAGMEEKHAAMLLNRTERMSVALDSKGLRLALAGNFPRFALRKTVREVNSEPGLQMAMPWSGVVLVSQGDHTWLKRAAANEEDEEGFFAGALIPGEIAFFLEEPASFVDEADLTGVDHLRVRLVPKRMDEMNGFETRIDITCSDAERAKQVATSLKTALFVVSRQEHIDDATTVSRQRFAKEVLRLRAVGREGTAIVIGPVFLREYDFAVIAKMRNILG